MLRCLTLLAVALGLTGCFLPTPVSIVSIGADVVSFVFSGKTVADHGISVAMNEDCAMMGVLEGEICDDQPDYRNANVALALAPLPSPFDVENLADTDAQVLASAQRAAAVFGDTAPTGEGLDGSFVADAKTSSDPLASIRPRKRPTDVVLLASAAETPVSVPLPSRRPEPQSLVSGGFLADATIVPGGDDVVALQVALVAPQAGPTSDPMASDAILLPIVPKAATDARSSARESASTPPKAQRPRAKTRIIASARTIERTPQLPRGSAQQRLSASRAGSEVGRAPTVQTAIRFSPPKARGVAKRYTRSSSSEMGS